MKDAARGLGSWFLGSEFRFIPSLDNRMTGLQAEERRCAGARGRNPPCVDRAEAPCMIMQGNFAWSLQGMFANSTEKSWA